jgi:hypothetical protein
MQQLTLDELKLLFRSHHHINDSPLKSKVKDLRLQWDQVCLIIMLTSSTNHQLIFKLLILMPSLNANQLIFNLTISIVHFKVLTPNNNHPLIFKVTITIIAHFKISIWNGSHPLIFKLTVSTTHYKISSLNDNHPLISKITILIAQLSSKNVLIAQLSCKNVSMLFSSFQAAILHPIILVIHINTSNNNNIITISILVNF